MSAAPGTPGTPGTPASSGSSEACDARVLRRPFTLEVDCLLVPAAQPGQGRPPLLACLHGHGESGTRMRRWMGAALPPGFAAAFPDGFHRVEVRRPERPIRIGHAWYHYSTEDRQAFLDSLTTAVDALWDTLDAALAELGADGQRLWLAGFSQGAYLAHVAALRRPERVAGWIAQAGGLRVDYVPGGLPTLDGRPVLLQHGEHDRAASPEAAREIEALLRGAGADVELQLFDAGHVITPEMAAAAREWLAAHA